MAEELNHLNRKTTFQTPWGDVHLAEDDRFIGESECDDLSDLSSSQRYELMKQVDENGDPKFPQKYQLSPRRSAWLLSEVRAWMAKRIAASRKAA